MPRRNASYHPGHCGGGRGSPLSPPGGRGGGAGRWSQPGCIPAGEDGNVLDAWNDIHFFFKQLSISIYFGPGYVPQDHVKADDFQSLGWLSQFAPAIGVQVRPNITISSEIYTVSSLCTQIPEDNLIFKDIFPFTTTVRHDQTAAVIFLPILFVLLYVFASVFPKKRISTYSTPTYHQLVQEIKDVLHPPSVSATVLLKERAEANQRLLHALHISNTFVSPDPHVHKTFVTQAQHLMKTAQRNGWAHFQAIVIDAVQWQLSQHNCHRPFQHESKPFKFDSFVQNVTLVVVVVGILQVDKPVQSFSHKDVTLVASRITTLWALSKKSDPIPPALLPELTAHLRRLVVDEAQFPNPLDFVIPTWETLWRVVATTVAYSYRNKEIRKAFEEFNACPSDHSFRGGDQASEVDASISVKAVVSEAMRLHPPSKRIGRSKTRMWWAPFSGKWIQGIMTVKRTADVEKLFRCEIWGQDADEFRPSRHSARFILPEQTEAFSFGFGYGPLRCIAASWAPTAAGVISGAILDGLDISGYVLKTGAVVGGREGWNDWVIEKTAS